MRTAPATAGVVSIPLLDLRRRPAHTAEMRSQLILGEIVDVLARTQAGRWLEVRNRSDGYSGWVRAWGLVPASAARARRWSARARHVVRVLNAAARTGPGRGLAVSPLVWQSRL